MAWQEYWCIVQVLLCEYEQGDEITVGGNGTDNYNARVSVCCCAGYEQIIT